MPCRVDIIIRARNGHELTEACLRSIQNQTNHDLYRIILCDDGSSPKLDKLWHMWPEALCMPPDFYLYSTESRGAVSATNMGLALSLSLTDSEFVIVLDNDTEVPFGDDDWLARWIAEMESFGPGTAACGATTDKVSPPQQILGIPPSYTTDWHDENRSGVKIPDPVPYFISFAVMLRKSAIHACGFWDTRYDPGNWEDVDYSLGLREAGYAIRVARSVYLHHKMHATFGEKMKELLEVNGGKFQEKWGVGRLWDLGILADREMAEMLRAKLSVQQGAVPA